jgi:hypothetical protein
MEEAMGVLDCIGEGDRTMKVKFALAYLHSLTSTSVPKRQQTSQRLQTRSAGGGGGGAAMLLYKSVSLYIYYRYLK